MLCKVLNETCQFECSKTFQELLRRWFLSKLLCKDLLYPDSLIRVVLDSKALVDLAAGLE